MDSKPKKRRKGSIDWDNMKVTFVSSDLNDLNPLNPYSHMSQEQRDREIIKLAAKIWRKHCEERMENGL